MCTACREMKPKKELVRVVKTPEGEIKLDFTGKLKLTIGFVSKESMDLDNQIKAIQDELSHYYSFNDNQIAALNAVRLDTVDSYDKGRMYIKITNVNTDDEER